MTGLPINQDTDNLIEVTDRNRKRIEKEEKDVEHAYSFKIHNSEGY